MTSWVLPDGDNSICRWCKLTKSEIQFEDSLLCLPCHAKALHAAKDPKLHFLFRVAMDSTVPPRKHIPTCKWCSTARSEVLFEGVNLCLPCRGKAIHASQNPKLCSRCSGLLTEKSMIEDLFSEYGFDHSSARHLREASADGCMMCKMMWLQDPNEDEGRLQFTALNLFAARPEGIEPTSDDFTSSGDINLLSFSSEEGQFRLDMSVSALPDNPAANHISQRPPEEYLGSDNVNRLIRGWLDECFATHSESLTNRALPRLPTRVVDVGIGPNPEVKLFETPQDFCAHYVTLSYCWGRPRFLTTVLANLEEHKKGLDLSSLPLTFQDAILTTRNLGFRYVWIDALCIIQDSNEDKSKEIGKMGVVYSDSTLTIAVVGATAVAEGFLKSKVRQFVDLPYRCPDGTLGSVRVSPQKESDLWDESLYTRAWCLQENLLSPRLLLYTDTEVIWQCQTSPMKRPKTTHASYVRENPNLGKSPFSRLPANVLKPATELEKEAQKTPSDAERYQTWASLVQNYTKRNLTVASDRLPALSGIAQKFEAAWKDKYLAGIWQRQLLPSLAWRRSPEPGQQYYPALTEYRAPSWSWASIDGPVEFDSRFDLGNARGSQPKIISCCFDMGSAQKDAILVEGYMIPVAQLENEEEDRVGQLYMDNHPDDGHWLFADKIADFDEDMKALCWRFLLGEGKEGAGKMMRTTALVLMQASGEDEDTFTRIGLWKTSVKGASKLWIGNQGPKDGGKIRNNKRDELRGKYEEHEQRTQKMRDKLKMDKKNYVRQKRGTMRTNECETEPGMTR